MRLKIINLKKINILKYFIKIFIIIIIIKLNIVLGYAKNLYVEDFVKENFIYEELKEYINQKVPKLSQLIDTKIYLDYLEISQNGVININNKIDTQLYPFKYYKDGKARIYTVLSLSFPKNMYISKEDIIKINTNLYFEKPDVILLGRNKENEEWKKINIIANTSLDEIYIYSDQIMDNKYKDFKIIISFSSIENEYVKNKAIYYNIHYLNHTIYKYIKFINIIVLFLLVIIFTYILLRLKNKKI